MEGSKPKVIILYGVPEFLSSRLNWVPHPLPSILVHARESFLLQDLRMFSPCKGVVRLTEHAPYPFFIKSELGIAVSFFVLNLILTTFCLGPRSAVEMIFMIEEATPHQDFQPDPQNIGSRTILDDPLEPPRKPHGLENGPQDIPGVLQNLQSEKEDDKEQERPETYDDYLIITEEENSDESVAPVASEAINTIPEDSDVNSDADARDVAANNRGIASSIKDTEASDEAEAKNSVTEAIDEEVMPQNSDEDNSDDITSEASTEASESEAISLSKDVPLEDTGEIEDSLEVVGIVGNRVGSFNSAQVKSFFSYLMYRI